MDDAVRTAPAAWHRRWFLAGLLVLLVFLSVQYSLKVRKHGEASSAFNRWRQQVLALEAGEDAYQLYQYPNPPTMALILLPYYKVPELAGALAWYYTKVALALASLLLIFRLVEDPERPFPEWAKALTVLLSLKPIMGDLTHGNINLLILFLVIAALFAYRSGKDVLSGVTLALAIVCKVTPALFVPYFLWKRAWKTLAGCVVGLVLFYVVIPGLYFGQRHNLDLLQSWSDLMIKPALKGDVAYSEHPNQSLPGLVSRLLMHKPSFSDWIDGHIFHPVAFHNVVDLSPTAAKMVILGSLALFAAVVMWTCRTPPSERHGWRPAAEFSIILLGMLLFSERTWKHHCVTFALPFAVICYQLALTSEWRIRARLGAVLGVVALLMASTSVLGVGEVDDLGRMSQVYGAYIWVYLILIATLAVLLRSHTPSPAPQGSATLALPFGSRLNVFARSPGS
jgi:hypothetical protein